jgi:NAD-dependent dihydropyrimidine dehydrogenase PreA subunit
MKRHIIVIDEKKCDGCGLCVKACHEGAIALVDGKARLLREDYCDGLGNCLPACPCGAITFEQREALPFNESAAGKKTASAPWPIQIKLVAATSPALANAHLLIAADCCAYSVANFYNKYVSGKTVLIGCPKLDAVDYSAKLADIFLHNNIASVTVTRMEVPCCGGIEHAVRTALKSAENDGKKIKCDTITFSIKGEII